MSGARFPDEDVVNDLNVAIFHRGGAILRGIGCRNEAVLGGGRASRPLTICPLDGTYRIAAGGHVKGPPVVEWRRITQSSASRLSS